MYEMGVFNSFRLRSLFTYQVLHTSLGNQPEYVQLNYTLQKNNITGAILPPVVSLNVAQNQLQGELSYETRKLLDEVLPRYKEDLETILCDASCAPEFVGISVNDFSEAAIKEIKKMTEQEHITLYIESYSEITGISIESITSNINKIEVPEDFLN